MKRSLRNVVHIFQSSIIYRIITLHSLNISSLPVNCISSHSLILFNQKKFIIKKWMFILFALVGVSCNQKSENAASTEAAPAAQLALLMPVNYSSSFEIGNPLTLL